MLTKARKQYKNKVLVSWPRTCCKMANSSPIPGGKMAIHVFLCAAGEKDLLHGEQGLLTEGEQRRCQELGRRLGDFNQIVVSVDPHAVHTLLSIMLGKAQFGPVKTVPQLSGDPGGVKFAIKQLLLGAQVGHRILVIMPAERLRAVCQAFVGKQQWTQEFEPRTIARLTFSGGYTDPPAIEYDSNPREAAPPCSL